MRKRGFKIEDILTDKNAPADALETPLAGRVFLLFRIIAALVCTTALIQVLKIGVWKHDFYRAQAEANMQNIVISPAERGLITDRNGNTIASNEKVFKAILSVRRLPADERERDQVTGKISAKFDLNKNDLEKLIEQRRNYLDDEILLSGALLRDEVVNIANGEFIGVKVLERFKRVYPAGEVFSHVLGYIGLPIRSDLAAGKLTPREEVGKTGFEKQYDAYLRGKNGIEISVRDSLGRMTDHKVVSLAAKGATFETFLDKDFQEYFYRQMQAALKNLNRKAGTGIAMNPENGEILALFSLPSFDAGRVGDYLINSDLPLFNRAVSGLYNPGSTIKPLVALAALTEAVILPNDKIFSAGYITVPNPFNPAKPSIFKDWKAHGWIDVHSALARSSNVYFYEVGGGFNNQKGLGIKRLKEWWKTFRLDEKTGIDLPEENSGFLPDPEWKIEHGSRSWLLGDTYNVSIGQGDLTLTPIGLLNYISAVANGGIFYKPRIMKKIITENGWVTEESKPEILKTLPEESRMFLLDIQKGMRDAVMKNYGTAHLLADTPLPVAAKTGSAQIANNQKTNAFFTGYFPADKPELAILIVVEDAREGSLNAIPIAREVFQWYYENRIKTDS